MAASSLGSRGYALLQLFSGTELAAQAKRAREVAYTELAELRASDPKRRRSLDPSGKLSGSANHHVDVRRWRSAAWRATVDVLREVVEMARKGALGFRLDARVLAAPAVACCPDALMARASGERVPQIWHRDAAHDPTGACRADLILGGWLNLDADGQGQPFVCVPGSHVAENGELMRPTAGESGFCKLSESEAAAAAMHAETVLVPPGALLIFVESLTHRTSCMPTRRDRSPMLRLFTGARLSYMGCTELYPELQDALRCRGALPIKSGRVQACLPRNSRFKATKNADRKALEWIDRVVVPELQNYARSRLRVFEGKASAWPPMDCLPVKFDTALFPPYSSEETAAIALHLLAPACSEE